MAVIDRFSVAACAFAVASVIGLAAPAIAAPPVAPPKPRQPATSTAVSSPKVPVVQPHFAVVAATIHTLQPGAPPLADGVLVVQAGRIACLGVRTVAAGANHPLQQKVCAIAAGVPVHEVNGGVLVPGLIEALGRLGQVEVEAEDATHDGVAGKESNAAHVQAIDGVQMQSRVMEATRRGGVTTVLARPMGNGLVVGQGVAFRTIGEVVDDALVRNPVSIHVNIGEEAKSGEPLVGARSGQVALLRVLLERAKRIADADMGKKPKDPAEKESLQRLRDDPGLTALARVFSERLPLVAHTHRADDIAALLRLQEASGPPGKPALALVIAGGAEAHVVADRLAAAKVPVILGPVRERPYAFSTKRSTQEAAALLHAAGVTLALATADTFNARHLRWEAGYAVAGGLPWQAALAGVTRNVAQIFGLGAGVGELVEGQVADFAVYSGDPLAMDGRVVFVAVAGLPDAAPVQR